LFLTDPALRRIAAATGDVWHDRVWRFDTAEPGAHGELAKLLHDTSARFADSANLVGRTLRKAAQGIARTHNDLAKDAHLHLIGTDRHFTDTLAAIERHSVLEQQLLRQCLAWRTIATPPAHGGRLRLLVRPGDPSWGVVALERHDKDAWRVFPDAEAAAHFGVKHAHVLIGVISPAGAQFAPAAYLHPESPQALPQQVFRLPECDDMQSASRSLMRWWAYRDSPAWDGRMPAQFTPIELAALAE
jgi:hypothetical protein